MARCGVAGNYDYEEGGIIHEKDATAILALANHAEALCELWKQAQWAYDGEGGNPRGLGEALAKLEAV